MNKISKKSLDNLACYIALVVAAGMFVITRLLPEFGITISGEILSVLTLVKDISLLVGVGFGAYHFSSRTFLFRLIFWIAAVVYIGVVFFGIF